ncbi:MAG: hypothetical protein P4L53_24425 [Candidatus Obscuribacterales bacterium]|nr:hypothetical protein [Candidatus Obscuribacterales bacterium]
MQESAKQIYNFFGGACHQKVAALLDTKADKDEIEKLSNFPKPDYSPHFITPIIASAKSS